MGSAQVKLWAYGNENWKLFDVSLDSIVDKKFSNVNISETNFKFTMLIKFYS